MKEHHVPDHRRQKTRYELAMEREDELRRQGLKPQSWRAGEPTGIRSLTLTPVQQEPLTSTRPYLTPELGKAGTRPSLTPELGKTGTRPSLTPDLEKTGMRPSLTPELGKTGIRPSLTPELGKTSSPDVHSSLTPEPSRGSVELELGHNTTWERIPHRSSPTQSEPVNTTGGFGENFRFLTESEKEEVKAEPVRYPVEVTFQITPDPAAAPSSSKPVVESSPSPSRSIRDTIKEQQKARLKAINAARSESSPEKTISPGAGDSEDGLTESEKVFYEKLRRTQVVKASLTGAEITRMLRDRKMSRMSNITEQDESSQMSMLEDDADFLCEELCDDDETPSKPSPTQLGGGPSLPVPHYNFISYNAVGVAPPTLQPRSDSADSFVRNEAKMKEEESQRRQETLRALNERLETIREEFVVPNTIKQPPQKTGTDNEKQDFRLDARVKDRGKEVLKRISLGENRGGEIDHQRNRGENLRAAQLAKLKQLQAEVTIILQGRCEQHVFNSSNIISSTSLKLPSHFRTGTD
eukprot:sb/3463835/